LSHRELLTFVARFVRAFVGFGLAFAVVWSTPLAGWAEEPYLRANTRICVTPQGILVHYDCPKLRALARKFKAPNLAQQEGIAQKWSNTFASKQIGRQPFNLLVILRPT
jgi:hypothetical protein